MALTTTSQVLEALQQYDVTPEERSRYDLLRRMVESAVISYVKWPILQDTVFDFYDGTGKVILTLRQPYVSNVANVWLDPYGYAGQGTNGFSSQTLLTAGQDYMLQRESPDVSKCGQLVRLSLPSLWFPSAQLFLHQSGGLAYAQPPYWQVGQGNVKTEVTFGFPGPVALATPFVTWSGGVATFTTAAAHGLTKGMRVSIYGTNSGYDGENYRVATASTATTFTISFLATQGTVTSGTANAIPTDIQAAVCAAIGLFRSSVKYGWPLANESLGDYSYGLHISREVEFGTVRQLLGQYRDFPIAGI